MAKSTIEWTEHTWNPVTGCSKVSAGCKNCYAETIAKRFWGDRKFSDVMFHPEKLDVPILRRKPTTYFVNSMSDLFHEKVTAAQIIKVFAVMESCPQHTFQVLTKRIERAIELLADIPPLKNVWIGVSVENQTAAEKRIPFLLDTPAHVRWISAEPLLGPLDLNGWINYLDWVVVGGESGSGARPMNPDWAISIHDQCKAANVPFFFKQWGEFDCEGNRVGKKKAGSLLDGREYKEYPIKPRTVKG